MVTIPIGPAEPKSRKKGKGKRDQSPPGAPGFITNGPDGATYAPLGHYPPPQAAKRRNSPARPRSSTSLSQQLRSGPPPQFAYQQGSLSRHFSEGNRPPSSSSNSSRRPLPDEDDWVPTSSRRNSVASHASQPTSSQLVDPFDYQDSSDHAPMPGQFLKSSPVRPASGPPDIIYSTVRRNPPLQAASYPTSRRGVSDPALNLRKRTSRPNYNDEYTPSSSEEEDDSDDLGNGVQVFVEDEPEKPKTIPRKPVGGRKKGKGR